MGGELLKVKKIAKVELTGSKTCQCGEGEDKETISKTGASAIKEAETECKEKDKVIHMCGPTKP